jgi:hypothetical protein
MKYKNAFARRDMIAQKYEKFAKDENTTVNAKALYPYEVVEQARECRGAVDRAMINKYWDNLEDYFNGATLDALCVIDTSGSMTWGSNRPYPIDVAISLGLYCAERARGPFAGNYVSFSSRPQLVDMGKGRNLHDKLQIVNAYDECSNTNIEATFDLVLKTAVANNMKQEDIPNLLIISDMEFDGATTNFGWHSDVSQQKTLFKHIADKFAAHGYTLPKLVFWNVCSRTGTIPMKQNDAGVGLVSGFSVNVVKAVLSDELDPYKVIVKTLNAPRYENIKV